LFVFNDFVTDNMKCLKRARKFGLPLDLIKEEVSQSEGFSNQDLT